MASGAFDLFLVYEFIKRLATPFNEWEAYDLGIIDERGNILKKKTERNKTTKERAAFGKFDLLVLKLKKLLEKLPAGQTRVGSYAAALWLIKEHQQKGVDVITEEALLEYIDIAESLDINEKFESEFGEEIANSVGSGKVAGIGYGPDGEVGFTPKMMKKYKDRNKKDAPKKRLRDIL
jgi:hypothetical protein